MKFSFLLQHLSLLLALGLFLSSLGKWSERTSSQVVRYLSPRAFLNFKKDLDQLQLSLVPAW
jgi:hypothetical protein